MPEIITSHLTHFAWAAVCLIVALLVHFWPTIKAKAAAYWDKVKAAFAKDDAKVKAQVEQTVAAEVKKVADATADSVKALITRMETLERVLALAAASASATVVNNAPATQVDTGAPTAPVQGWVAPAAPQA